jgi:type IV pilus assembly protein PilB
MEVPHYKLTASLRGVLAQRLLRKVCPECSAERPITEAEASFTGLRSGTPIREASSLTAKEKENRKAEGTLCTRCDGTGYRGRIGTYELLRISRNVSEAIKKQKSTQEIEDIAVDEGMLTLKSYGVRLVAEQRTTVAELRKICNSVN